MAVSEQHSRQVPEADTSLQDLALCALATVHQEPKLVVLDDLR